MRKEEGYRCALMGDCWCRETVGRISRAGHLTGLVREAYLLSDWFCLRSENNLERSCQLLSPGDFW